MAGIKGPMYASRKNDNDGIGRIIVARYQAHDTTNLQQVYDLLFSTFGIRPNEPFNEFQAMGTGEDEDSIDTFVSNIETEGVEGALDHTWNITVTWQYSRARLSFVQQIVEYNFSLNGVEVSIDLDGYPISQNKYIDPSQGGDNPLAAQPPHKELGEKRDPPAQNSVVVYQPALEIIITMPPVPVTQFNPLLLSTLAGKVNGLPFIVEGTAYGPGYILYSPGFIIELSDGRKQVEHRFSLGGLELPTKSTFPNSPDVQVINQSGQNYTGQRLVPQKFGQYDRQFKLPNQAPVAVGVVLYKIYEDTLSGGAGEPSIPIDFNGMLGIDPE